MVINKKMKAIDVELAVVRLFGYRQNLIIPNVSWGFSTLHYEADLVVVTKAGYAKEVEIKVSKYDLIKDKKKRHSHNFHKFKELYFAIPDHLLQYREHIPERAGIISVIKSNGGFWACYERKAARNSANPLSNSERYELARLGALRIWDLKRKLRTKTKQ